MKIDWILLTLKMLLIISLIPIFRHQPTLNAPFDHYYDWDKSNWVKIIPNEEESKDYLLEYFTGEGSWRYLTQSLKRDREFEIQMIRRIRKYFAFT